jgi:AAA domain
MRLRLVELRLIFKRSTEVIVLADFNYFYGQMGAGKSSIARLIDYCLGGNLDYTVALQAEFVSASLEMTISGRNLRVARDSNSNQIRAQWNEGEAQLDLVLPARSPAGVLLPNTEVEVLSDLIFNFVGSRPPRVRRSKIKDDSELQRLSFRDLFWYCYLEQDDIDSSFFHLDAEANTFQRLKSRDVMRFVIGFHQEKVAELEVELEEVRLKRAGLLESYRVLKLALEEAEVGSETEIDSRIAVLRGRQTDLRKQMETQRNEAQTHRKHAADQLRERGRVISHEIQALEEALETIQEIIVGEQSHLNELRMLTLKVRRDVAARAVLSGVEFEACPRCAQTLPKRHDGICIVCGQDEPVIEASIAPDTLSQDVQDRQAELDDSLKYHQAQLKTLGRRKDEFQRIKGKLDAELDVAVKTYDSAYLSSTLALEREEATLEPQIIDLNRLRRLPQRAIRQLEESEGLAPREEELKRLLREAREIAEKDTRNLKRLEKLFLDCLVRAKIPGFSEQDTVSIRSPSFLPEVASPGSENMLISSFANLGSGGKKTLFKACFAIAIHRLATEIGAILPTLLIIDSPMKNISERENIEQFEGFHALIYELALNELADTQFILIDKEFSAPPENFSREMNVRHMKPGDPVEKPLITYFSVPEINEPQVEEIEIISPQKPSSQT